MNNGKLEKVIEAWEIFRDSNPYEICSGREFRAIREPEYCMGQMIEDTIALLKEQEPILLENQHKPYGISTNANSPWISRCPKCGKKVEGKQTRFCKYCGQAVKWDAKWEESDDSN